MCLKLIPVNEGRIPASLEIYSKDGCLLSRVEAVLKPQPVRAPTGHFVQEIELKKVLDNPVAGYEIELVNDRAASYVSACVIVRRDKQVIAKILAVSGHGEGMDYTWVQWEIVLST